MPKQSIYSPGTDNNHTTHKVTHGEWWRTEDDINDWLAELRKEVDAPDLWNEFQQQKEFAASLVDDGTDSDTPFTQPERKQIIEALDDIKKQLVNMRHWDVQQAAIIDNQFKHMEEASNRIGRKDWMLFIYGSIMSVLINLSVTPEQGHAIMALADSLMRPVFHKVNLLD